MSGAPFPIKGRVGKVTATCSDSYVIYGKTMGRHNQLGALFPVLHCRFSLFSAWVPLQCSFTIERGVGRAHFLFLSQCMCSLSRDLLFRDGFLSEFQ